MVLCCIAMLGTCVHTEPTEISHVSEVFLFIGGLFLLYLNLIEPPQHFLIKLLLRFLELSLRNALRRGASSVSLGLIGGIPIKLTINREMNNSSSSIPPGHLFDDKLSVT